MDLVEVQFYDRRGTQLWVVRDQVAVPRAGDTVVLPGARGVAPVVEVEWRYVPHPVVWVVLGERHPDS